MPGVSRPRGQCCFCLLPCTGRTADEPPTNHVWLEDFLALARTGNFSRAAEERHSSQPAFSRRIRALEDWIGVALVDRSTQPARLTDAGEFVRAAAQELVARTARLPGEARQVAQASAATLRIASTHALSFTFLPRWLRALESTLPLGQVELVSDVLERCEAQMQQGAVQFVLSHAHPRMRGALDADAYLSATVGADRLLPVATPGTGRRPLHRLGARTAAGTPVLIGRDGRRLRRTVGAFRPSARPWSDARPARASRLASGRPA